MISKKTSVVMTKYEYSECIGCPNTRQEFNSSQTVPG